MAFFNKKDKDLLEKHKSMLETIKLDIEEMHTKYDDKWDGRSERFKEINDHIEDSISELNEAAEGAQTAFDSIETFLASAD